MEKVFLVGGLRPQTMLYGAESVIEAEQVTKDEMDAWVLRSYQRAARAAERGIFSDVILPIGPYAKDEGVHTRISQRLIDRLPPVLSKGTLLNAANACRINDGAAFVLLVSGNFAEKYGLPVQAELIGTAALGCNPSESPRGAQWTAEALLRHQGLFFGDLSAIEFNEAFAVIDVLFARRYPKLVERYNRFGGALAYGHPSITMRRSSRRAMRLRPASHPVWRRAGMCSCWHRASRASSPHFSPCRNWAYARPSRIKACSGSFGISSGITRCRRSGRMAATRMICR